MVTFRAVLDGLEQAACRPALTAFSLAWDPSALLLCELLWWSSDGQGEFASDEGDTWRLLHRNVFVVATWPDVFD